MLGCPSHETIDYLRRDGSRVPAAECPLLRPRQTGGAVDVDLDWSSAKTRDTPLSPTRPRRRPQRRPRCRRGLPAHLPSLRLTELEVSALASPRRPTTLAGGSNATSTTARSTVRRRRYATGKRRRLLAAAPDDAARLLQAATPTCAKRSQNSAPSPWNRPAEPQEEGLIPARGRSRAGRWSRRRDGTEIGQLRPAPRGHANYIAAEAIAHAVKHARARQVEITLARTPRHSSSPLLTTASAVRPSAGHRTQALTTARTRSAATSHGHYRPAGRPSSRPISRSSGRTPTGSLSLPMPLRLVLADDAALIRQALAELLQRAGVEVVASRQCAIAGAGRRRYPARHSNHRHPHAPDPDPRRHSRGA